MKIGLFDINKSTYNKMRYEFPEIDLMKVYSYYKKSKNNVIELSQDFHEYINYDLYYCFNNRRHIVSKELLQLQLKPNVYLVGTCFYGDVWFPMDEEIEKCEPDIIAYSNFLRTNIINETLPNWVETLFNDSYYLRYYYPDWHWNLIPEKIKNKRVILYDFDLTSNDGWQELCLKILKDSGRKFVCRHNVTIRSIEELKFIINNELYKSSTKYPTKFILEIPESLENFKSFCDEYFYLLEKFPANSLFVYQNHYKLNETQIERFAYLIDTCMYFLNSGREIYPIYDNSKIAQEYDLFFKRVDYYFTMRKPGTIVDILQERGKCDKLLNELQENYPIFYNKICTITRAEVKKKEKVWIYGER